MIPCATFAALGRATVDKTSSSDPDPQRAAEGAVRPARILVVEDEFLSALSIEAALLDAGYEVAALVATGEEAVRHGPEDCDLALMDIRLAGEMDGVEAAIRLRAAGVPSIFSTAYSGPAIVERARAARPLGWLVKPISDAQLLSAVRKALGRHDPN